MLGRIAITLVAVAGAIYGGERLVGDGAAPQHRDDDGRYDDGQYQDEADRPWDEPYANDRRAGPYAPPAARMSPPRHDAQVEIDDDYNPRLAAALTEGGIYTEDGRVVLADPSARHPAPRPVAVPGARAGSGAYQRGFQDGLLRNGYARGVANDPAYHDGYRDGRAERDRRFAAAHGAVPASAPPAVLATTAPAGPPPDLRACATEAERLWSLQPGAVAVVSSRVGSEGERLVAVRASGRKAVCVLDSGGVVRSLDEGS